MASIPKQRKAGQRRGPRTLAEFQALPKRVQDALQNVAHVVTRMRAGESRAAASAYVGIDPRTVQRLGGSALRKTPSGRYVAKPTDNLLRVLKVSTNGEPVIVAVRGSRASTEVSKRSKAQREYLATGDDTKIGKLRRTKILDAEGREVPFLTDLDELDRQGDLGVLSFESIYARRG